MADWRTVRFEDLMKQPTRNGIHKGISFQGKGIPIIKMGEVYSSEYIGEAERDLLDLSPAERSKLAVIDGDLLFCRTSLVAEGVGRCALVRSLLGEATFASNLIRVKIDPERADVRFIHFIFRSPLGQQLRGSIARGTSVTTITGPDLASLEFLLPPLDEQRRIADLLGALDDKIESNYRLINIVDSLIRAEVLRATNNDSNSIATTFGEITQRISEVTDPRTLVEKVSYIGLEHMPRGSLILNAWGDSSGLDSGKSKFRKGDILFGRLRPYFKKVGVAPVDGICSTEILVLRPTGMCPLAVFAALSASVEMINFASTAASGTKMPRVSWEYLQTWPVRMPGPETLTALDRMLGPMLEAAISAVHQNQKLAAMRDALLPGLLSGQIRMPQAESLVEELV